MRTAGRIVLALTAVLLAIQVRPLAQSQPAPILLVVNSTAPNPFGRYLGEILRTEGINAFSTVELSSLSGTTLNAARLVVLAETPLTASQATLLSSYVAGGGRLVAMRPDAQLGPALGVTDLGSSSSERYLSISAGTSVGSGFPATTLPMVGPSRHYGLASGAIAQATLYTDRTTSTPYPAVVQYGRTATWAFDLGRSIVYTRQGNPANAGTVRDGIPPVRTTSLFYGAIDLDRVGVPYADLHMRLFARLVTDLLADALPLPRLWYFPASTRSMLIPTADTHVDDDLSTRQQFASVEAHGGRLSQYISRWVEYPNASEASAWRANGHEFGLHPYGSMDGVSLDTGFQTGLDWFTTHGLGAPSRTIRFHQIEWPSWVGPAQLEATNGIGLDTTFYTWGPAVTYPDGHQAHGFINGSGLPMRFVDQAGIVIPVYQQVTSIIDEQLIVSGYSEQLSSSAALDVSRQLIDDSQAGGYSALVTQFHTDYYTWGQVQPWAEGTMDYARSLGIPIWTAERWLKYVESRAATQVSNVVWSAPSVNFSVTVPAGAEPQTVLLPALYAGLGLTSMTVDGASVTPTTQTITGRNTLFFSVGPGTHAVTATFNRVVPPVNHPPAAVNDTASVTQGGSVTIPVLANDSDPDGDPLVVTAATQGSRGTATINADSTVTYTSGATCGTDSFSYTISDGRGGTSNAVVSVSIACTGGQVTQTTVADFNGCGPFNNTMLTAVGDGEIRLAATFGDEYSTAVLNPARWVSGAWGGGAYSPTVSGGVLSIAGANGVFVRSATPLPVTTLETTAQFSAVAFEHIGWADLDFAGGRYLIFSTYNGTTHLYARSADGSGEQRADLGLIPVGFHTYRIERAAQTGTTDLISYYIDGVLRTQHTVTTVPAQYVYQSIGPGGASPTLDVDRLSVYPAYVPSGTFQSCMIDAGSPASWDAVVWSALVPAGTTLAVATRTSADATTWSDWSAPTTASGSPITSLPGRYLQYQLSMSSGSPQQSPVVDSVTLTNKFSTDTTTPTITAVAVNGLTWSTAVVSWATTDKAATSQVQYGTTAAYGLATALDPTLAIVHAQTLGGLAPGTLYHFRVLSRDASGNQATSGDLTFNTLAAPPNNPPTAANDTASVAQGGSVTIPVLANDSDPDGDPLAVTAVTQGTLGAVVINADNTVTYTAAATCAPDSFTYTIADGRGGVATATVTVTCSGGQITQTTAADFSACGTFSSTMLTAVGNGEVRLAGTFGDEYTASTLDPTRWIAGTWSGGAFTPAPTGGVLSLAGANGAFVRSAASLGVTTLEATARFSGAPWEHVGWGALDFNGPYLLFSTAGNTTNLYARSADNSGEQRTDLGPIPAGFHVYRIERATQTPTTDQISYYVDGTLRAQHTVATVAALYVYQSHNGGASPSLDVDRLWVYPTFLPNGTFQSCALDAGSSVTWATATWSATVPAGGTLSLTTRTSADGLNWSDWSAPYSSSGGAITNPAGRYLQYLVSLASGSGQDSPSFESIALAFSGAADTTPPTISAVTVTGLTSTTATITWATNKAATSQVNYGTTASYGLSTPLDSALVAAHAQALANLTPNTLYHYQVLSRDAAGNAAALGDFTFTTPACDYQISPATQSFGVGGGTGSVAVFTSAGCAWTATTGDPWITFTSSATGTGNGSVSYAAAPNTTTAARNGGVSIAGQLLSVSEAAPPAISISDVSVTEGNTGTTNATFTVTLSAASSQAATVVFATADGTATAGSDYVSTSGVLTFAPGVTTQTIAVPVVGDTLFEADESFVVNLSGPSYATIADSQGVGTILNDDTAPALRINDVSVTEGNTGTTNATFTVTLSGASALPATVAYATANGTATAGSDYLSTSGTLTFAPGVTTQTVVVPVVGDTLNEANETFFVNLSGAGNATIADSQGVGTVVNDDPVPSLGINDVSVTEGNTGTLNAVFTVTLSPTSGQTVTVPYSTANGTATAGSDYNSASGTLTFAAGSTSQTVTVVIRGDTTPEADETYFVNLGTPTNATIAKSQGLGTILNNDGTVTVTSPNTAVSWAVGSTHAITWNHTLGSGSTMRLELSRNGGTSWELINASVSNAGGTTGSYNWVVTAPTTTTARVRATWTGNSRVTDISNVNFTIR